MNETVLALVGAVAIYGLVNLALPRPSFDPSRDLAELADDTVAEEPADAAIGEDETRQLG